MPRPADRAETPPSGEFLSDPEGARLLKLGTTKFAEIQRTDPTFPPPVWLGERVKRHVRSELLDWALSKRQPVRPGRRA